MVLGVLNVADQFAAGFSGAQTFAANQARADQMRQNQQVTQLKLDAESNRTLSDQMNNKGYFNFEASNPDQILNVNTLIADSAVINRVRANFLYAESADVDSAFTHILRGHQLDYTTAHIESAEIAFLSGKKIEFDSGRIRYLSGEFIDYDSASFGRLNVRDSATFGNVTVNKINITSKIQFDSIDFSHVFPFTIKDSAGLILLGGYLLSTDSDINVP